MKRYFVAERMWSNGLIETIKTPTGKQRRFTSDAAALRAIDKATKEGT